MKALEIRDVGYSYPDGNRVLDGVCLSVNEGESLALAGPNGVGKSTLLLTFNGILFPRSGGISVLGRELNKKNLREIRKEIGLVFQNPDDQLFAPTVFEDVAFGLANSGLSDGEIRGRVEEALEAVGMGGFGERHPFTLSFGEKKKISVATVLSMRPEILVFDEPTLGIDPWSKPEFLELFRELNKRNTTIYATHDPDVMKLCKRVVLMEKGGKLREKGMDGMEF